MRELPLLIMVLAIVTVAVMGSAQAAGIQAVQIEGTIYQFSVTETYTEPIRWSFGDGVISTEANPVHEFGHGLYNVIAEDGNGKYWQYEIDTRLIVVDENNATITSGDDVYHGGVMLAIGVGMCWLAGTDQHFLGIYLGRFWKGMLVMFYVIMMVVGGVLVLMAVYNGGV